MKLAMPGAQGSGVAVPRNGSTSRASTLVSTVPASSAPSGSTTNIRGGPAGQGKKGKRNGGITGYLVPKAMAAGPSQLSRNEWTLLSTRCSSNSATNTTSTALIPAAASAKSKGKRRAVIGADDELEDEPLQQHWPTLDSEVNLRSERSEHVGSPPGSPVDTTFKLPPMPAPLSPRRATAPTYTQPSSLEHPSVFPKTIFGFGAVSVPLVRSGKPGAAAGAKRKRVIETSSPAQLAPASTPGPAHGRTLVSPSSDLSPLEDDSSDSEQVLVRPDAAVPAPSSARPRKKARAGSRVPWDSDDEAEIRRLNPTSSEARRQQAYVSPAARQPPTVENEVTMYMDEFREESYSPVQFTMETEVRQHVLKQLGVSPKKREKQADRWRRPRKPPAESQRGTTESIGASAAHLDSGESDSETERSTQASAPVCAKVRDTSTCARAVMAESPPMDESATERSLLPQRPQSIPTPESQPRSQSQQSVHRIIVAASPITPRKYSTADDSGFVPSSVSPGSNHVLAPDSEGALAEMETEPEAVAAETELFEPSLLLPSVKRFTRVILPESLSTRSVPAAVRSGQTATVSAQECVSDSEEERDMEDDLQEVQVETRGEEEAEESEVFSSQDDDSQTVASELLGTRLPKRDFRKDDTVLAPDTQELLNLETQDLAAGETQYGDMIPCSQGLVSGVADSDDFSLALDLSADETELSAAVSRTASDSQKAKRKSIGATISSAWFGNVLHTKVDAAPEQTALTRFFTVKPGAAAEKAEREQLTIRSSFARVVGQELKEQKARRVSFRKDPLQGSEATTPLVSEQEPGETVADSDVEDYEDIGPWPMADGGETQYVPSSQTQPILDNALEDFTVGMQDSHAGTQEIATSDAGDDVAAQEDSLDADAAGLADTSCELWIGGKEDKVPSPVKRRRTKI